MTVTFYTDVRRFTIEMGHSPRARKAGSQQGLSVFVPILSVCLTTKHPWRHRPTPVEESGILRDMRCLVIGVACACALTAPCFGTPAQLGAEFADAYAAFAPLYLLHRSYADYLFRGTPVAIPSDLEGSCARFSYELALFHLNYSTQTGSTTAGGLAFLSRLRSDSVAFCDTYAATIAAVAELEEPDGELLTEASDAGLFAEIKRINDLVATTLDEILVGMGEGIERWTFAVTFSVRTLLSRPTIERIDANLREILYADPEGIAPPFDVPAEILLAMERLIELSGRALTAREAEDAVEAATLVCEYFIGDF